MGKRCLHRRNIYTSTRQNNGGRALLFGETKRTQEKRYSSTRVVVSSRETEFLLLFGNLQKFQLLILLLVVVA